ncbi:MAG: lysozyme [Proteobacteria bacterium]|nr:lysozyme [Pseudomonadota bacterium]
MSRLIKGAAGALTAAGLLAASFVASWEGRSLVSYRDIVGFWTGCDGVTKGMGPNMRFTDAQCDRMLVEELVEHEKGMRGCLKTPDQMADKTYVAFLSLTYNIGVGAFCKSTTAKRINAGDLRGACEAATWFDKAGGRKVKGLEKRRRLGDATRKSEYQLCIEGLR